MCRELISIIIPVYNAEQTLSRCLDSVLQQTYENIEIILIDDGSVDGSKSICKQYRDKYNNIKFYSQSNKGVASARNVGIQLSNGKYIGFIDSDDVMKFNFLECLYDDGVDMSIGSCIDILEDGIKVKKSEVYKEGTYSKKDIDFQQLYQSGLLGTCWGKLFKRELLDQVRFDESFEVCEDTIFTNICYVKAKTIKLVKEKGYFYQVGNDKSLNNKKYTIELLDIHEKANRMCIECLTTDDSFDKSDLIFKRDKFLEYYADYFHYFLYRSNDDLLKRRKYLKLLYKKRYFKELQLEINRILIKDSEKYRRIILLKRPLLELMLVSIQKRLRNFID